MMGFFGGIPTKPAVDRLLQSVNPEPGGELGYDRIAEIISETKGTSRFTTIVLAYRKYLFRNSSLQTAQYGDALHFLTHGEAHDVCKLKFGRTGRAMRRVVTRTDAVDGNALSPQQQTAHNLLRRLSRAQAESISNAVKEIAAPKPVAK